MWTISTDVQVCVSVLEEVDQAIPFKKWFSIVDFRFDRYKFEMGGNIYTKTHILFMHSSHNK